MVSLVIFGLLVIGRPLPHHADDGVGHLVEADLPADNRSIAAEALLPQAIREDHDLVASDDALVFHEGATQRERLAVA